MSKRKENSKYRSIDQLDFSTAEIRNVCNYLNIVTLRWKNYFTFLTIYMQYTGIFLLVNYFLVDIVCGHGGFLFQSLHLNYLLLFAEFSIKLESILWSFQKRQENICLSLKGSNNPLESRKRTHFLSFLCIQSISSSVLSLPKKELVKILFKIESTHNWFEFHIQIIQISMHGFEFLFDYGELSFIS